MSSGLTICTHILQQLPANMYYLMAMLSQRHVYQYIYGYYHDEYE